MSPVVSVDENKKQTVIVTSRDCTGGKDFFKDIKRNLSYTEGLSRYTWPTDLLSTMTCETWRVSVSDCVAPWSRSSRAVSSSGLSLMCVVESPIRMLLSRYTLKYGAVTSLHA